LAADLDPTTLYELSTEGTTQKLKVGESGRFVLAIRTKPQAHVSDEAPLKLELKSTSFKIAKEKQTYADSVTQKAPGEAYAQPRFEAPFIATAAGKGTVEAKLSFFVCTDKLCLRQQKNLSVSFEAL
ncbi:MAG: hypothetical protein ACT4TC_10145, partial [Myxococcaceae bacterium]